MKQINKAILVVLALVICTAMLTGIATATGSDDVVETSSVAEEGNDIVNSEDTESEDSVVGTESVEDEDSTVSTESDESGDTTVGTESVEPEDTTVNTESVESTVSVESVTSGSAGNTIGAITSNVSSEKTSSKTTTTSEIRIPSDTPYNGSSSEMDWTDTEMNIVTSSDATTSVKTEEVKKDIFDLRSLAARIMVLTGIVALLSLAAIIYINVKNRQTTKEQGEEPKKKLKTNKKVPRKPRS